MYNSLDHTGVEVEVDKKLTATFVIIRIPEDRCRQAIQMTTLPD